MRRFLYYFSCLLTAHVPLYLCLWIAKQFGHKLKSLSACLEASVHLDVTWYLGIAERGYWLDPWRPDQSTAFFPLLPYLWRAVHWIANSFGLSWSFELVAFLLARFFFCCLAIFAGWYWQWHCQKSGKEFRWQDGLSFVFFFFCQPALVIFAIPYTEALFAILFTFTFVWLSDVKLKFVGVLTGLLLGYFLVLCRPTGIFFSLPVAGVLALAFLHKWGFAKLESFVNERRAFREDVFFPISAQIIGKNLVAAISYSKAMWRHMFVLGLGLAAGVVSLLWLQYAAVGDPLSFLHVRAAGWNEIPGLANLIPFVSFQIGGMHTFRIVFVSLFVVGLCAAYQQRFRLETLMCGLVLVLPLYQGKAGDIVRYVGVCIPVWAAFFTFAQKRTLLFSFSFFIFSTGCLYFFLHWLNRVWVG